MSLQTCGRYAGISWRMGEPVVVIGAGMAGLAAARAIAEAGRAVVVLEASERVGGRIFSVRGKGGAWIELGAEFIHGRPAELWALIAEAGLATYERTGSFLGGQEGAEEHEPLEELKTYAGADMSFAEYVSGLPDEERQQQIGYVEGFNAADAQEASVLALGRQQVAEDAIEGDRVWKIHGGYAQLPEYLAAKLRAAGGRIEFGARVVEVSDELQVRCADGRVFAASDVVVALPLGVLQAGAVRLPATVAIPAGLRIGQVWRMTFCLTYRLWPEGMSFLLARGARPAVWWTDFPGDARTLTGWSGGPGAAELLGMSEGAMRAVAEESLAVALELTVEEVRAAVEEVHFFDWQADPLFKGAYSWVAVGGVEDSARLGEVRQVGPGRLVMAGEHTDRTGLWGTVHAAYGSGLRVGRILRETTAL